jgi:DNA helicase-2/ATP-dependent DNA helicase PcrA
MVHHVPAAVPAPPPALGRGVIVNTGDVVSGPWSSVPVTVIDEDVLADPAATVDELHRAWLARRAVVVELAVDPVRFRAPQSITGEPWQHTPRTEPHYDRLHFLVWANNYDARDGKCVWWWTTKACRVVEGATPLAVDDPAGDIRRPDGSTAWIDGGPRQPWNDEIGSVIAAETIDFADARPVPPPSVPTAELAPDQLAAVGHVGGAARIIAPAGSGKTRVLTERLRHLLAERGYERDSVLAVAYNKQAQLEMQRRTTEFSPHVRTLNSLGLWVLAQHRGASPPVIDEREARRMVEEILPGRWRRRSNTDPIAPYLEGLSAVRLGLRVPADVEAERDDVEGLSELFDPFRERLKSKRSVDFDEQVYGAIEVLLADGEFRRSTQRSCRHVLVDEFQDLTPAHVLLLRLLALPALDVFGVGDDDQCIYGHAGADPAFLIDYADYFPGAAAHALRVNYRCATEVVGAAATLLGYNHRRVPKEIVAGAANDTTAGALVVDKHRSDEAAARVVDVVRRWLDEPGVDAAEVAVLARVNSVLLAPHVALHDAGIPLRSALTPDVLTRTGLRAALAYLRIGTNPQGFAASDVVEILRRPTRGLPQWFPERLGRRRTWTVGQIAGLATQLSEKDEGKVLDLADDLSAVVDAAREGTTRHVLEVVRDVVGLGDAMSMLDRSGSGQGSSHLDDLDGLLAVADLHPDASTFEAWLHEAFQRENDPGGVTLSTIHRVKGREWDRVVVFGVSEGLLPHRLSEDVEEERRVLHVGITRGRHRVTVLADASRPSPFLAEMAGTAPKRPARPAVATVTPISSRRGPTAAAPEAALTGEGAAAEQALRAWRTERSRTDGVPAYIVLSDKSLRAIAAARPDSARALLRCDGIGPTKLERYGDEILAVLSFVAGSDG